MNEFLEDLQSGFKTIKEALAEDNRPFPNELAGCFFDAFEPIARRYDEEVRQALIREAKLNPKQLEKVLPPFDLLNPFYLEDILRILAGQLAVGRLSREKTQELASNIPLNLKQLVLALREARAQTEANRLAQEKKGLERLRRAQEYYLANWAKMNGLSPENLSSVFERALTQAQNPEDFALLLPTLAKKKEPKKIFTAPPPEEAAKVWAARDAFEIQAAAHRELWLRAQKRAAVAAIMALNFDIKYSENPQLFERIISRYFVGKEFQTQTEARKTAWQALNFISETTGIRVDDTGVDKLVASLPQSFFAPTSPSLPPSTPTAENLQRKIDEAVEKSPYAGYKSDLAGLLDRTWVMAKQSALFPIPDEPEFRQAASGRISGIIEDIIGAKDPTMPGAEREELVRFLAGIISLEALSKIDREEGERANRLIGGLDSPPSSSFFFFSQAKTMRAKILGLGLDAISLVPGVREKILVGFFGADRKTLRTFQGRSVFNLRMAQEEGNPAKIDSLRGIVGFFRLVRNSNERPSLVSRPFLKLGRLFAKVNKGGPHPLKIFEILERAGMERFSFLPEGASRLFFGLAKGPTAGTSPSRRLGGGPALAGNQILRLLPGPANYSLFPNLYIGKLFKFSPAGFLRLLSSSPSYFIPLASQRLFFVSASLSNFLGRMKAGFGGLGSSFGKLKSLGPKGVFFSFVNLFKAGGSAILGFGRKLLSWVKLFFSGINLPGVFLSLGGRLLSFLGGLAGGRGLTPASTGSLLTKFSLNNPPVLAVVLAALTVGTIVLIFLFSLLSIFTPLASAFPQYQKGQPVTPPPGGLSPWAPTPTPGGSPITPSNCYVKNIYDKNSISENQKREFLNKFGSLFPNSLLSQKLDYVIETAQNNNFSPALTVAIWGEESHFSNYGEKTALGSVEPGFDLGCLGPDCQKVDPTNPYWPLECEISCFLKTARDAPNHCSGATSFEIFMKFYSGGDNCTLANNEFFWDNTLGMYKELDPAGMEGPDCNKF